LPFAFCDVVAKETISSLLYLASLGYAIYVFTQTRNHIKRLNESFSVDVEG
jgi:hypothetical protein